MVVRWQQCYRTFEINLLPSTIQVLRFFVNRFQDIHLLFPLISLHFAQVMTHHRSPYARQGNSIKFVKGISFH